LLVGRGFLDAYPTLLQDSIKDRPAELELSSCVASVVAWILQEDFVAVTYREVKRLVTNRPLAKNKMPESCELSGEERFRALRGF
jgi:hypothetical protein